jgi:hypothetical protein
MGSVLAAPLNAETPASYRCAWCDVESSERTGFIVPEKYSSPPREVRCLTCEHLRRTKSATGFKLFLGAMVFPLMVYGGFFRSFEDLTALTLLGLACCVPIGIIAHELGHAIAARVLGLEVGAIVVGRGRKLFARDVFGVSFRVYAWPISGHVYIGGPRRRFMRTRIWLTFLMGPLTNGLLAFGAVVWWPELQGVFGAPLVFLWIVFNASLLLFNLLPYRITDFGQSAPNDGLALLQIPRYQDKELAPYAHAALYVETLVRFEDGDYRRARSLCLQALERAPSDVPLLVALSACESHLCDHAATAAVLKPLLESPSSSEPLVRATIQNNLAFALLMSDRGSFDEADRLSSAAVSSFPCQMVFRTTRSLVLAANGRPEEALAILEYRHFKTADRKVRGHQEAARAFAYHQMDRHEEATAAAARSIALDSWNAGTLAGLRMPVGQNA